MMMIVDAGTSNKFGDFLEDKSDATTQGSFENFRTKSEMLAGKKIQCICTDGAFDTLSWRNYIQTHGITHELSAPYPSSQNGLAECAIRTTMEDVHTLLQDSGLSHSYWAEAAAYSIYTQNLIPSRRQTPRPDTVGVIHETPAGYRPPSSLRC
jgi:hypothetical protein